MEWNDELVLEFARISQKGSYGAYEKAPKIEDKLQVFKELHGAKKGKKDLKTSNEVIVIKNGVIVNVIKM